MGVHANIGFDFFPKQGYQLNCEVEVCFRYDTTKCIDGVIIRDDMEEPYLTLIKLSDGRVVTATECQYSVKGEQHSLTITSVLAAKTYLGKQ